MARKAPVKKTDAYRHAEATLGGEADLDAVQKYIRDTFKIEMSKQQISQYRSIEKRRNGMAPKRTTPNRRRATTAAGSDTLLEFVSSVRGWEDKLGADKICEVIAALYKS